MGQWKGFGNHLNGCLISNELWWWMQFSGGNIHLKLDVAKSTYDFFLASCYNLMKGKKFP
jgi:hypothetical protein